MHGTNTIIIEILSFIIEIPFVFKLIAYTIFIRRSEGCFRSVLGHILKRVWTTSCQEDHSHALSLVEKFCKLHTLLFSFYSKTTFNCNREWQDI